MEPRVTAAAMTLKGKKHKDVSFSAGFYSPRSYQPHAFDNSIEPMSVDRSANTVPERSVPPCYESELRYVDLSSHVRNVAHLSLLRKYGQMSKNPYRCQASGRTYIEGFSTPSGLVWHVWCSHLELRPGFRCPFRGGSQEDNMGLGADEFLWHLRDFMGFSPMNKPATPVHTSKWFRY